MIYFGNFRDMLDIFWDPSSGFHEFIFDAALFKWIARQGLPESLQETLRNQRMARTCRTSLDGNRLIFKHFYVFLPLYKIEVVDPINLEAHSSIKLRKHKVT